MKTMKKICISILTITMTIVFGSIQDSYAASGLKIHYIDVGSGDAIYIECDGENMLIDGGYLSHADRVEDATLYTPLEHQLHNDPAPIDDKQADFMDQLRTLLNDYNNCDSTKYLDSLGVNKINYIVSSHPHYDHVGGLLQVINKYTYDHIYYNGHDYDTRYYKYFKRLAEDNVNSGKVSAALQIPHENDTFNVGSAKITVLSDQTKDYSTTSGDSTNNGSVVLRLDYGQRSFLFTGDAQVAAQKNLIDNKASLISNVDVLKVPHHGHTNNDFGVSEHSGNYNFFVKTNPVISIVQSGIHNTSSAIPTAKVRKDLSMSDIYTSKEHGNIVLECDGKNITIKTKNKTTDYLMIKDNIMGKLKLNSLQTHHADINNNKRLDAADYLKIKDFIMGKISKL